MNQAILFKNVRTVSPSTPPHPHLHLSTRNSLPATPHLQYPSKAKLGVQPPDEPQQNLTGENVSWEAIAEVNVLHLCAKPKRSV